MIRKYIVLSSFASLIACGGEGGDFARGSERGPPVVLHPARITPSCWTQPPVSTATTTAPTSPGSQEFSASRQIAEFRLSFQMQWAQVMSKPLLEDPTASRWSTVDEGPQGVARHQAQVQARGDNWGFVFASVSFEPADDADPFFETFSRTAQIQYSLIETLYDFGDHVILIRDDYIKSGDYERGCNGDLSFEVGPGLVDGRIEPNVPRCWRPDGFDSAAFNETPGRVAAEAQASLNLQCLQIIERVRVGW